MQNSRAKLLFGVLSIGLIFIALLLIGRLDFVNYRRNSIDNQLLLHQMWEEGAFLDLVSFTEERLQAEPLHPNYLLYNGLARYYTSSAIIDTEEQSEHIHRSISRLRKLLLLRQPPQISNVYLILGKAYYRKGQLYYPQAIEYIELAFAAGLENEEAYQYLGAAYAHLGQYDKSIAHLTQAIQHSDSLPLKFALADIYILSGDIDSAEQLYRALQTESLNSRDMQRLILLQVDLLIARQEYQLAVEKINEFLVNYSNVAEAYFKLGEAYRHLNEIDRARYNWRIALKIDPNHTAALRQLQR